MLRWLVIGIALVLVVGTGTVLYLWRQATALPAWAEDESARAVDAATPGDPGGSAEPGWIEIADDSAGGPRRTDPAASRAGPPASDQPPPRAASATATPTKRDRPRGRKRELRNFHLRAAAKNAVAARAIRRSRAVYEDGELEAGVVVELSRIPRAKLGTEDQQLLDRAFSAFPFLRDRAIYVGIEDAPVSRNGFLQLGRKTRVRVGKLDYSLAALARKLGVDPRRVRAQLDRELRRLKVTDPGE